MSRIGKKPITIPQGVSLTLDDQHVLKVKGPKGELTMAMDRDISLNQEDGLVTVTRPTDQIRHKSLHGLYRSLVANMITGVSEGFTRDLELVGVGYRASVQGQMLDLSLGFSHNIMVALPDEVKATATMVKGQAPKVTLESHDKQLLGQVAAKIRSLRKPEPYKGKGVRFAGEYIRRKAGKAASK